MQKAASILGLGQERQGIMPSLSLPEISAPTFSLPGLPSRNSPTVSLPGLPGISLPSLQEISAPITSPLKEASDFVRQQRDSYSDSRSYNTTNSVVNGQSPTINITVSGTGQDEQSLAERIAQAVSEALRNISSLEERISYA